MLNVSVYGFVLMNTVSTDGRTKNQSRIVGGTSHCELPFVGSRNCTLIL